MALARERARAPAPAAAHLSPHTWAAVNTCVHGCPVTLTNPDQPNPSVTRVTTPPKFLDRKKQNKLNSCWVPHHNTEREREKKTHLPHVTQRWPSNCLHPDETTVAQKEMAAALPTVE